MNDLNKLTTGSMDYFIYEDLNARHTSWNCMQNNTAGIALFNHQLNFNYYIYSTSSFTRFSQNETPTQQSVIDIILSNFSLQISSLIAHPGTPNSDHSPISCGIHGSMLKHIQQIPLYMASL